MIRRADNYIANLALSSKSHFGPSHIDEAGEPSLVSDICYLRPTLQSLGVDRIKEWMQRCESTHQFCSMDRRLGSPGLAVFRLADVVANALVEIFGSPPPYFALSYVWGSVQNFRLTTMNRPGLMRLGAIQIRGIFW